jgi:hypothetical protein
MKQIKSCTQSKHARPANKYLHILKLTRNTSVRNANGIWFYKKKSVHPNLVKIELRTSCMAWSHLRALQRNRISRAWLLRVMMVCCLICAMPMQMLLASANQLRALAHHHEPFSPVGTNSGSAQSISVGMIRLGFVEVEAKVQSDQQHAGHFHANTGYHFHLSELKDLLTIWLNPVEKWQSKHDVAQDNAGTWVSPLGLPLPSVWDIPKLPDFAFADLTIQQQYKSFHRRLERPPKFRLSNLRRPEAAQV